MFPLGSQRKKNKANKKSPHKGLAFIRRKLDQERESTGLHRTNRKNVWCVRELISNRVRNLKKHRHSKGRAQQSGFPFSNELRILSRVFLMRSAVSRADGFWYQHSFISFTRAERVLGRGNKKTNTRTSQELHRKFVTLAVVQKKKKSVESDLIRGEGLGSGVCLTCSRLDF